MTKRFIYILGFLLFVAKAYAQQPVTVDSLNVLTLPDFTFLLRNYHPVARQADLIANLGLKTQRKIRGQFDPVAYALLRQKYFDDKKYYNIFDVGLAVPTWFGVTFIVDYTNNRGVFLNPQNFTPPNGFLSVGGDITLVRNLFIDRRRATFRQAELFVKSSEAQKIAQLNDLYFDAITQYWNWTKAHQQYEIADEFVELSQTYFEAVKKSYFQGLVPAIDTLAAQIQVQEFQIVRNNARLSYQQESYKLSNFLWYANNIPLEVTEKLVPPDTMIVTPEIDIAKDSIQQLISGIHLTHPELVRTSYKIDSLNFTRRLKLEGLKPVVNVGYRLLLEPASDIEREFDPFVNFNDYIFNVSFNYPLLIRSARGDLQVAKIKIAQTENTYYLKRQQLSNKVRNYYAQIITLNEQVQIYNRTVSNYRRLVWGETKRFEIGESSIFIVNQRQQQLQNAYFKLIDLKAKYKIAQAGVVWASGQLFYVYNNPLYE